MNTDQKPDFAATRRLIQAAQPLGDYRVYGLTVRSDIELVGWPLTEASQPEIRIHLGPVSAPDPPHESYQATFHVEPGLVLLAVHGVARYAVSGGSEIVVEPYPDARSEDVLLYLMGAMFGAALHQRGIYPLHAAAVDIGGTGVAFAGPSGAGKSTLVALLTQRGARLITDDISVIEPMRADEVGVWPGAARIKLDSAGLEALRETNTDLDPAGGNRHKFHLPINPDREVVPSPVPLRRLFLLEDSDGAPAIEPLTGMEAMQAVIDETYFIGFVSALGLTAQNFRLAAGVARAVKVCRLRRPRGFEHLQRVLELVEADVDCA